MRFREWILTLCIAGAGMMFANYIGFDVAFSESLPGVAALLGISLIAVCIARVLPIKLPTVAYCSLVGLLLACPFSPVSAPLIEAAGKINFTAPLTMVGAYAGISISGQLKIFAKQGWKMIVIALFVMTGTFLGSLLIAQGVLTLTNVI